MGEVYSPRGIGSNWIPCGFCGKKSERAQPDMAAFVDGKDSGERVVTLLATAGITAILDYRRHEPNWVQVKIGACETHKPRLQKLYELTAESRTIDETIARQVANS